MPRSYRFELYLRSLPSEERKRIEQAEAEYLESRRSRDAAYERDFADSMVGAVDGDSSRGSGED